MCLSPRLVCVYLSFVSFCDYFLVHAHIFGFDCGRLCLFHFFVDVSVFVFVCVRLLIFVRDLQFFMAVRAS